MLNRILIVIGLAWAAVGGWSTIEPIEATARWTRTTGRLVDVDLTRSRPGFTWRRMGMLEYTAPGGSVERTRSINSTDLHIGASAPILLDPADAGRAYLPGETSFWLVPAGLVFSGLFAALVGWTRSRNGGGPVKIVA